jgi:glycosyltransferase involved in cell wall biosynthesis
MGPILSICIPTYNRCKILKDSINVLVSSLSEKNIELCISNNASLDDTQDYLDTIKKDHKKVNIIHQKINNGLEQNMIDAIKMATGKYILPIGDDEKIDVDKLDGLLELLDGNSELILLNGFHGKNFQLGPDILGREFSDPNSAFIHIWNKLQPGSFIVKADLLENNLYDKYMGTSHAYSGWVLDHLHTKFEKGKFNKISTYSEPIIEYKQGEKTWAKDAFKIMYYEIPLWFDLLSTKYTVIKENGISTNHLVEMSKFSTLLHYRSIDRMYNENAQKYMNFFSAKQLTKAKMIGYIPKKTALFVITSINHLKNIVKWIMRY